VRLRGCGLRGHGLLLGLDELDERGDLLVVELAGEARHLRGVALDDLGVGLEDRLADVVVVDGDLPGRAGLGRAVEAVAAVAALALVDAASEVGLRLVALGRVELEAGGLLEDGLVLLGA
jgi:hypothetical protein